MDNNERSELQKSMDNITEEDICNALEDIMKRILEEKKDKDQHNVCS
jgi:hypothetical protein